MSQCGKLYLLPVPISEESENNFIPEYNFTIVRRLNNFIAEDAKTARRFLKWFGYPKIENAEILLLNEHTKNNSVLELIQPLLEGKDLLQTLRTADIDCSYVLLNALTYGMYHVCI